MAGNCRHPGTFTVPGQDGADRVTSPNQLTDPPGLHPAARILGDRGRRVIARHRARRTGAIRRIPRAGGSCKGPPVLIALAVSGCMSSPAGPVGGVEFGSEGRARDGCEAAYV